MIDKLREGVENPEQILPYLRHRPKKIRGVKQLYRWGWKGVPISLSERKFRNRPYDHYESAIWEEDWDLLVILDACRLEWMEAVKSDFDFINSVGEKHSIASHSKEWMAKTFDQRYSEEMENTIYITGNHFAGTLDQSDFTSLVQASNYGDWAYSSASPPANIITDLAIDTARNHEWERCIVHYMQPHKPFLSKGDSRGDVDVKDWSIGYDLYKNHFRGELTKEDLVNGFISNLEYVLEEVELLLDNIDAPTTVLSADHGQALGDDGLWDHTVGVKHSSMKRVPWVVTSAQDRAEHEPNEFDYTDYDQELIEENLKQLGYI